jgi:hypothetical protein
MGPFDVSFTRVAMKTRRGDRSKSNVAEKAMSNARLAIG